MTNSINNAILAISAVLLIASCGQSTNQDVAQNENAAPAEMQASETQQHPAAPVTPPPAETIPNFKFYDLDNGMSFERSDLSFRGNIVFVFFDPTCSLCQHEAADLSAHYDRIKNASIIFVSMNDPALIHSFLPTHAEALVGKENVHIFYDRDTNFINYFHMPAQYPATYVYGSDGRLKDFWNGSKNIEDIIPVINQ